MTFYEYIRQLSKEDFETFRDWLRDPCWGWEPNSENPEIQEMSRKIVHLAARYGYPTNPWTLAALGDLESRVTALEWRLETLEGVCSQIRP